MMPSTPVSTVSSPRINVLQGLSSVIDDLSQPYSSTSIHIVSRWFSSLPSLYGRNKTLDATVRCFTAHHFSKMLQNDQMARYSRFAYIEALSSLRKSLNIPSERLSSDIFCAVLLLCLYEVWIRLNPCHRKKQCHLIKSAICEYSRSSHMDETCEGSQPTSRDSWAELLQGHVQ
jgi:hypothetical protein